MIRALAAFVVAGALAGCSTMNVISDGADSRLMLKGHDPVAYFTLGRPVLGRQDIKVESGGVSYRFASEDSRRLFVAHAAKYVPQYGGFGADGMMYAIPLGGEPQHFKIVHGRLFLFSSEQRKRYFEMDQARNITFADHYWDAEVRDSLLQWQYFLRAWINRVPHYKSESDLAEEYQRRVGKTPG